MLVLLNERKYGVICNCKLMHGIYSWGLNAIIEYNAYVKSWLKVLHYPTRFECNNNNNMSKVDEMHDNMIDGMDRGGKLYVKRTT